MARVPTKADGDSVAISSITDALRMQALVRELQNDLYTIARYAELGGENVHIDIQKRAEVSLKLIDSFLITSQLEAGQLHLGLSPYGLGSVLHNSAYAVRRVVNREVSIVSGAPVAAMTNPQLLQNLLSHTACFIAEATSSELLFRSFKSRSGTIGIGVFAKNFYLTTQELRNIMNDTGRSVMPAANHSRRSGIMLTMADTVACALGSPLTLKQMGRYRGLVTVLPRSEQLSLIS